MTIPSSEDSVAGQRRINLQREIIATILGIVRSGWERALTNSSVAECADEVCMTECLRDGMREAANKKLKSLIVAPGTESKSHDELRHPDGRTDIPMYLVPIFQSQRDHDPHAIIECKRVAGGDTHLSREYVVEGIDRFTSGKYGAKHASGFMVGYVLTGSPSDVAQSINAYFNRVGRDSEALSPSSLMSAQWARESSHQRPKVGPAIKLHHAFLVFEN